MNKVLTFRTIEDKVYNQMTDEYLKKNEAAITEIIGRWDRQEKGGCDKDLGNGLELTSIIELNAQSGRYYHGQLPDHTIPAICLSDSDGYKTIKKLAEGSRCLVKELNKVNFGALVTPLFVTVQTKERLIPEEARPWLEQTLKTELKELPFAYRVFSKYLYWNASRTKIRGLNDKEIKEFERLYWKEK